MPTLKKGAKLKAGVKLKQKAKTTKPLPIAGKYYA